MRRGEGRLKEEVGRVLVPLDLHGWGGLAAGVRAPYLLPLSAAALASSLHLRFRAGAGLRWACWPSIRLIE